MDFRQNQPMGLQIVEYVFEQIFMDKWKLSGQFTSIGDIVAQIDRTVTFTFNYFLPAALCVLIWKLLQEKKF